MADIWPVELKLVATVLDPDSGEVLETIEVDNTKPAPMQAIGLALGGLGYSPLFYDSGSGRWRVTTKDARRI